MAKRDKIRELEGSVSVTDNITPITRHEIPQIDSSQWPEMSINDLVEQRMHLNERLFLAGSSGNTAIIDQLQKGLNALDALIRHRCEEAEENDSSVDGSTFI